MSQTATKVVLCTLSLQTSFSSLFNVNCTLVQPSFNEISYHTLQLNSIAAIEDAFVSFADIYPARGIRTYDRLRRTRGLESWKKRLKDSRWLLSALQTRRATSVSPQS